MKENHFVDNTIPTNSFEIQSCVFSWAINDTLVGHDFDFLNAEILFTNTLTAQFSSVISSVQKEQKLIDRELDMVVSSIGEMYYNNHL